MSLAQAELISTQCQSHAASVNATPSSATPGTMMPIRNGMRYAIGARCSKTLSNAHRGCGWTKFASIQADLQCLPIFLAACNRLLIISGPTYTFRLWCCVELFVYVAMHMEDDSRKVPVIILIGADDEERARVHTSFTNFDAKVCKCFKEEDKARMLGIVERHPGGMQGFNSHVRALAATLCRSSRPSQTSSSSSCSQSSRPASMDASGWAEFSGSVASFEWHGTERCHSLTASASTNRNCDAIGFSVLPEATVIPGSVTSA